MGKLVPIGRLGFIPLLQISAENSNSIITVLGLIDVDTYFSSGGGLSGSFILGDADGEPLES